MAGWTVMMPKGQAAVERAAFIRDGFNWWAALFGPFWALANRMWIVAIVLGVSGILAGLLPPFAAALLNLGLLLTAGIFAADLQAWSLARRGFSEEQHLEAASLEEAESRFFAQYADDVEPEPAPSAQPALLPPDAPAADPLGLFGKGY